MEIKPLTIQLSWLIMHTWMTQCTNLSILLCLLEYLLWYCLVLAICHYGDSDRITWHMVQGDTCSPSPTQLNSSSNCLSFTSSCTMYILYRAQGNRDTYTCVHILSQNNLHIQKLNIYHYRKRWQIDGQSQRFLPQNFNICIEFVGHLPNFSPKISK